MPVRKIGEILDIPHSKAQFWIKRYKTNGIQGLNTKKQPGKKASLNKKELEEIKIFLIENKPTRHKGKAIGWNSREVKNHIKTKYKTNYSLRHTQRLLHKLGFSLITPRPRNIKSSTEKQEEFKKQFKKNSKKNIWIYK